MKPIKDKCGTGPAYRRQTRLDDVKWALRQLSDLSQSMGLFKRSTKPPDEDAFAELVLRTLKEIGDQRPATYDKENFRVVVKEDGDDAWLFNLRNIYSEYLSADAKDRSALLRRSCLGLASRVRMPDEFEDVKPDLLVTICARSMPELMRLEEEGRGSKWKELAFMPVSDHLIACLVFDLPTTMQYVTADKLEQWEVSLYEAVEIARQNLEEREFKAASLGDRLYVFLTADAFDASRLLLLDRIRSFELNGPPVAMAFSRDSLIVTGAEDVEGLGIMADLAERKSDEPRQICPIPHKLVDDDWEPWLPPAEHPHHEKFRILKLKYLYGEYAKQKPLLDKLHERTSEDIFVAGYSAVEKDGKPLSYCVWSKGVNTYLPETEFVALHDPQSKPTDLRPWDRLHAVVNHLMTPLDMYPRRWHVNEFPSPEEIELMHVEDFSNEQPQ
jgi:hypothetical protein